jgi:5-methylthioribose kinase
MMLQEFFYSWGPMLLLIGVWAFFMRRFRGTQQKQSDYMDEVRSYLTEHIAETKRLNQSLERIAFAIESKTK